MIIKTVDGVFAYEDTGEIISPVFAYANSKEKYEMERIEWVTPMTAQSESKEDRLEEMLNSKDFICEEKIDGTRGTLHLLGDCNRLFSRRVSKKTGWLVENSDSVPHLRDLDSSGLEGTIIDGEMIVADNFKATASILNCNWDKAIERQIEQGYLTFKAFDIIYYNGVNLHKLDLETRKHFLRKVIAKLNSPYIEELEWFDDTLEISITEEEGKRIEDREERYPNLFAAYKKNKNLLTLDKKAFYEYVVAKDGEGIMLKDKTGKYVEKRSNAYIKVKKEITKDCFIVGYVPPNRDYTGKNVRGWLYWEEIATGRIVDFEEDSTGYADFENYYGSHVNKNDLKVFEEEWLVNYRPVTKHYAKGWIGTIKYAVNVTLAEIKNLPKNKDFEIIDDRYLVVCETAGIDEELRKEISKNPEEYLGRVVELKANEMFKDTGRLRHPTFNRFRDDKNWEECDFEDHLKS